MKLTISAMLALALCLPGTPLRADDTAGIYKAKCVACHAADGSGSAMGKKLGTHDFKSPDTQKMTDTELSDAISKGKNKMPAYKTLKPEEVKALVAYIRDLGKGK